ncbi:hypothetical protein ACFX2I_016089 [Malus domestica]
MACGAANFTCLLVMAILMQAFMVVLSQPVEAEAISRSWKRFITVDKSGNGDYTKIQYAIDAVPSGNAQLVFIWVKPGVYHEKVVVPSDKPYITVSGTGTAHETVIIWNECGEIFDVAVFTVLATDFIGRFITIQNTYGIGAKAVALRVSADRAAFYACRILSRQDALFDHVGRHYYGHCYIEGDTDFIFGNAASFFEKCHLHSLSEHKGAITAQRRYAPSDQSGFTFLACVVTGVKTALLGRPWGPYSTVVFAYTYMSNVILPEGWDGWRLAPNNLSHVYYGQYKCYGPGAETSQRVKWSQSLTSEQVTPFLDQAIALQSESWQDRWSLLHPYGAEQGSVDGKNNIDEIGEDPSPIGEDVGVGWDPVEWSGAEGMSISPAEDMSSCESPRSPGIFLFLLFGLFV